MNKKNIFFIITSTMVLGIFWVTISAFNNFYKNPLAPSLELKVDEDSQVIPQSDFSEQVALQAENCGNTGSMKVLVLGVDSPFGGVPKGADAIRLVKVDFSEKEIVVVAIPRDLWVSTGELAEHDIEEERLGLTYYYGKLYSNDDETAATNILAQTIYDNFEVAPDYYFNIHMDSFAEMVDEIGGIDINIPARFHTPSGDIEAGAQTLDGLMTMEYARTMLIDTEWDRLDRQNLVLHALRDEILSLDILPKVPELFAQFESVITTDLSPEQLVDLSCMVDEVPKESILLLEISSEMVEVDDEGVMHPDFEKIIEFLQGIFGNNGS